MHQNSFDVVGVGNAIVDVISNVDDDFVLRHGLNKGAMTLIDQDRAIELYASMPAGIEASGGSAANTMAGLASFGGRAGYIGTVAAWIEGRYDERMPGGESGHEFLQRYDESVAAVLRALVEAGQESALVVSHGAALRTWVSARVPGVESHAKATDPLHNTACIELVGDPVEGWTIESWHSEPVGGAFLDDLTAPDPTGQATDEAADAAPDQS